MEFKIILIIVGLMLIILLYCKKSQYKIENYDTAYNIRGEGNYGKSVKPFGTYIKPFTNAIFDKNWNFITLQDTMPRLERGFNFTQIPCPNDFEPEIQCWQYNRIIQ